MKKRMLLVTYVFPPFAAVGVYRILKFCKYLRDYDIEPLIFTPGNPNMRTRDDRLISQVPDDLLVYRSTTLEPFRWKEPPPQDQKPASPPPANQAPAIEAKPSLATKAKRLLKQTLSIPDQQYFWIWAGLFSGVKVAQDKSVDIILSSSPPQSTHVLASRIAGMTQRPHLVDFRDLWTQNTSYSERNFPAFLNNRDRRLERGVLQRAAGISVNTASFKQQLLEKNSFLSEDQIEVITNGVDPDDFSPLLEGITRNDRFTMLYTGSVYGQHRNPEFFLAAVRQWLAQKPEYAKRIKLVFIGNYDPEFLHLFKKYRLEEVVEPQGWMPQTDAIKATLSADLLLLFQGFDKALSAAIPRKLYEYMITNRPILAFAPPGEIPDLIERYNCGRALSERRPEPIVEFLQQCFDDWASDALHPTAKLPTLRSMPDLEASMQVKRLAELVHRLT